MAMTLPSASGSKLFEFVKSSPECYHRGMILQSMCSARHGSCTATAHVMRAEARLLLEVSDRSCEVMNPMAKWIALDLVSGSPNFEFTETLEGVSAKRSNTVMRSSSFCMLGTQTGLHRLQIQVGLQTLHSTPSDITQSKLSRTQSVSCNCDMRIIASGNHFSTTSSLEALLELIPSAPI